MRIISFENIGRIATLFLGFLSTFSFFSLYISDKTELWQYVVIAIIFFFMSIAIDCTYHKLVSKKTIRCKGKTIKIHKGDIFDGNELTVIPVNRFFDTLVDDVVISSRTLHGKFIMRYRDNHPDDDIDGLIA